MIFMKLVTFLGTTCNCHWWHILVLFLRGDRIQSRLYCSLMLLHYHVHTLKSLFVFCTVLLGLLLSIISLIYFFPIFGHVLQTICIMASLFSNLMTWYQEVREAFWLIVRHFCAIMPTLFTKNYCCEHYYYICIKSLYAEVWMIWTRYSKCFAKK